MYILAEAAQGYEGSVEKALMLVLAAHKAKADGIKFQIIFADELCVPTYEYYELFKSLEMPVSDWKKIVESAKEFKIDVFFDVFGTLSLNLAKELEITKLKIHSTSFFDDDLFNEAKLFATQILISIGGIRSGELDSVLKKRIKESKDKLLVMYGFQSEPTPIDKNNLARIETIRNTYDIPVGFMDHSEGQGIVAHTLSSLALGLGVNFFEKHITLDRKLELEDYVSALGPTEFSNYVDNLKSLNNAIGISSLILTPEEEIYRSKALKVVVSTKDIKAGQIIDNDMIELKRPEEAVDSSILKKNDVLGKTALQDIISGQHISNQLIQ
jgi:N,N'-diacetyllegionaminate synthase